MASNILRNALAYKESHRQDDLTRNRLADFRADREEKERRNALAQSAGGMIAEEDFTGARDTLARGGDLKNALALQGEITGQGKASEERKQAALTELGTFGGQISHLPREKRIALIQAQLPQLQGIMERGGLDFDPNDNTIDDDDLQIFEALAARTGKLPGPEKAGPIQEVYDPDSPTGTRFVTRQEAIGQPGKPSSGQEISVGPDGAVNIRSGRLSQATTQPTTKPTTNKLQQSLGSLEESIARVQDIENRYQDGFLTVGGRIRNLRSRFQDKADIPGMGLSTEDREFLKKRKQFEFLVDRDFNAYRKEITGAAASMQELERLKKAMLNTDLSPAEFEATLEIYQDELMRAMRIKRRLLREGITVGDKGFGDAYDRLYLNGSDDDINTRGQELLASGMDMEAATKQLVTEGYISPSGAPE